jgi:DNA repair photolyase
MKKKISGTLEWAVKNANCYRGGCPHDCRYCFARYDAVHRFHTIASADEWHKFSLRKIDEEATKKTWPKIDGVVMFPSQHDIFPEIYIQCLLTIRHILEAGNKILIVSKPHRVVIENLCIDLKKWQSNILFRFTIGSANDKTLRFWEPGAPSFEERWGCLRHACEEGYKTSVSVEPCLDWKGLPELISLCGPHVTDSIWIGIMRNIVQRVTIDTPEERAVVRKLQAEQSVENVRRFYEDYKQYKIIRWKESIKKMLGLKLATRAGLDV